MHSSIVEAIADRRVIELRYHRFSRIVEPYVYGAGRDGIGWLRCYQIAGESDSGEMVGWKLLRVDEIATIRVTETHYDPRAGYRPDDRVIGAPFAQV